MKKAVLFGTGRNFDEYMSFLFEYYEIAGIVDNDLAKHGTVINGIAVSSPDAITALQFDVVLITPGDAAKERIFSQLMDLKIPEQKIIGIEQAIYRYQLLRYRSIFGTHTRFQDEKLTSSICRPTDLDSLPNWVKLLRGINQGGLPIDKGFKTYKRDRKTWEYVYICQALKECEVLKPGVKGLGFAVGKEPLPSIFANYGCEITASDAALDTAGGSWKATGQHSDSLDDLYYPHIVDRKRFMENITFKHIDMNNIPLDEKGYDFLWSSCALEHLGSIHAAKDFIYRAMSCLKPGGIAVHTTEFNLSSSSNTVLCGGSIVLRSTDLIEICEHLYREGHRVKPLDFRLDGSPEDDSIALPPYSEPHFKLVLENYLCTSFGLIIYKG